MCFDVGTQLFTGRHESADFPRERAVLLERMTMQGCVLTQSEMKRVIVEALGANDYDAVVRIARQSRRVMSVLVRLAYDKDTLIGWRAISSIGRVAAVLVVNNHEFLRETVRKLLWSLSDESGGIGWAAPEILGEIVSADPKKLADIVPLIVEVFSIEEQVFRPGILYALKRIVETEPEAVRPFHDIIVRGLAEQDPLARIYALELVKMLREQMSSTNLEKITRRVMRMTKDRAQAWVYKNDGFINVEVGELAGEVYKCLC